MAPDGIDAFPDPEDAALLTVLSHPELLFFILLTTERVTGDGGDEEKESWFNRKDGVDHHGKDTTGKRAGPSTWELCI